MSTQKAKTKKQPNSNERKEATVLSVSNHLTSPSMYHVGDSPIPAEMLINISHVTEFVTKDMILAGDCSQVAMQLDEFRKAGCKGFDKLLFVFEGYNLDAQGPFEIPEIRAYIQKLYSLYPELFLYIKEEQLNYILVCLLDFEIKRTGDKSAVIIGDTDANNAKTDEINAANKHYREHMCESYCRFYKTHIKPKKKYHSTTCHPLQ